VTLGVFCAMHFPTALVKVGAVAKKLFSKKNLL